MDDATVKRAGLDYWHLLTLYKHASWNDFIAAHPQAEIFLMSTRGSVSYADVSFPPNAFLVFGKETAGLPQELLDQHPERVIRLPMRPDARSLNLSNTVAVVLYEALRQNGFSGLE